MIEAQTIRAATKGDSEALQLILAYYKPYIRICSQRTFYDSYGNRYEFIDDDMVQQIESKLMYQIICSFDPDKPPREMLGKKASFS